MALLKKNILLLKARKITQILKLTKSQTTLLNKYVKKIVSVNKEYENDLIRFIKIHEDYLNNVNNIVLSIRIEDIHLDKKTQVETLYGLLNIEYDLSELLRHESIIYAI